MTTSRPWWVCEKCKATIGAGDGYVTITDAETGGYPRRPTPDDLPLNEAGKARAAAAEAAGQRFVTHRLDDFDDTPDAIAFKALHRSCDPHPAGSDYWIGVENVPTFESWIAIALHVGEKVWMGKHDLRRMIGFWYANRGLEDPSV